MKVMMVLVLLWPVYAFAETKPDYLCKYGQTATVTVDNAKELQHRLDKAKAGDTILVKGEYCNPKKQSNQKCGNDLSEKELAELDVLKFNLKGKGSADQPITVLFDKKATLTNVLFTMEGEHGRIVGGNWQNSQITIKGDSNRVTKAYFYNGQPGGNHDDLNSAVQTSGEASYNRIDHNEVNHWQRRSMRNAYVQTNTTGNLFDYNYLHNLLLVKGAKGENAGEAFQLGIGRTALSAKKGCKTTVEYNLVDGHNTDSEVISIKALGVTVQYNTFLNAPKGVLDTRHSTGSSYTGNYLQNVNGLQIYGDNNVVNGNYLEITKNTKATDLKPPKSTSIKIMSGDAKFDQLLKEPYIGAHPAALNTTVINNVIKDGHIILGSEAHGKDTKEKHLDRVSANNTCIWNNTPSKPKIQKANERYAGSHPSKSSCTDKLPSIQADQLKPLTPKDVGINAADPRCKS